MVVVRGRSRGRQSLRRGQGRGREGVSPPRRSRGTSWPSRALGPPSRTTSTGSSRAFASRGRRCGPRRASLDHAPTAGGPREASTAALAALDAPVGETTPTDVPALLLKAEPPARWRGKGRAGAGRTRERAAQVAPRSAEALGDLARGPSRPGPRRRGPVGRRGRGVASSTRGRTSGTPPRVYLTIVWCLREKRRLPRGAGRTPRKAWPAARTRSWPSGPRRSRRSWPRPTGGVLGVRPCSSR